MNILIVEVSKRKCITATFKAKPGVTIAATNTVNKFENKEKLDGYI